MKLFVQRSVSPLVCATSFSVIGSITEDVSNGGQFTAMVPLLNSFQNLLMNYPVLETMCHNNPSHYMKQGMVLKQNKFESESRTKTFLSTSFFLYFSCTQCKLMFGFRTSFIINKVEKNLDRLLVSLSARTVSNE